MFQLNDDRLLREALQARVLAEVFKTSLEHEFVLKGGMALRVAHGSERFTKDIDLDAPAERLPLHRVQEAVRAALKRALREDLIRGPVVTEPKQTATTLRWKINGWSPNSESPMQLTVEVSRRAGMALGHTLKHTYQPPAAYGISPVMVEVYDNQAIATQKVFALVSEVRVAPRDLFDLDVLIRAGVEPPIELLAGRGATEVERALAELWGKIEAMDWNMFRAQVLGAIPDATAHDLTEDRFNEMQVRVGEHVEGWLQETKRRLRP